MLTIFFNDGSKQVLNNFHPSFFLGDKGKGKLTKQEIDHKVRLLVQSITNSKNNNYEFINQEG